MLSQAHISPQTPAGATLDADGAAFRLWAPEAEAVYLHGMFGGQVFDQLTADRLLQKDARGYWTGYQDGARDGDRYRFWVQGKGSTGYKRDPRARELDPENFPDCFGILREAGFPWHDQDFVTPDFSDMVVYQLHVGTFAIARPGVCSTFLDVALRIPYLAALGINVLQPLPIDEQEANPNMGYGGADLFSPDFPYIARADLPACLTKLNALYAAKQKSGITLSDIQSGPGQLKALVDLCHVYGIAVMFDVVYNHAGGFSVDGRFDDNCLYYMDRRIDRGDNNDSLYFTDQDRGTGGLAFALWNEDVANFLLDNARTFLEEFHADGFRYDEISTLISTGQGSGWEFCRALTSALRGFRNRILQNAEFWPGRFADIPASAAPVIAPAQAGGMGFDVVQHDGLRGALRGAVGAASWGSNAWRVDVGDRVGALPARLRPRLARGDLRREPRPRAGRTRPAAARAGRSLQRQLLVRSQPQPRRHRDPVDRARHTPALHGPGVSGRSAVGRAAGGAEPVVVERPRCFSRFQHARPSAIHKRPDPPAPRSAGAARRQRPRILLLRP